MFHLATHLSHLRCFNSRLLTFHLATHLSHLRCFNSRLLTFHWLPTCRTYGASICGSSLFIWLPTCRTYGASIRGSSLFIGYPPVAPTVLQIPKIDYRRRLPTYLPAGRLILESHVFRVQCLCLLEPGFQKNRARDILF